MFLARCAGFDHLHLRGIKPQVGASDAAQKRVTSSHEPERGSPQDGAQDPFGVSQVAH